MGEEKSLTLSPKMRKRKNQKMKRSNTGKETKDHLEDQKDDCHLAVFCTQYKLLDLTWYRPVHWSTD
jgi:hypothetical protein